MKETKPHFLDQLPVFVPNMCLSVKHLVLLCVYEKLAPALKNGPRQVCSSSSVISNKLLSFCEFLLRVDLLIDRPRYRRLFISSPFRCHEFQ